MRANTITHVVSRREEKTEKVLQTNKLQIITYLCMLENTY